MTPENETTAKQNDFIGGLAPSTSVTPVDNSLQQAQQQAPDVAVGLVGAQPSPYSEDMDEETAADAANQQTAQSDPKPDYQSLYAQEVLAHEQTKLQLAAANKIVANAKAMGFSGAGIHSGT